MEIRAVCVLILSGFLSIEICTSSSCNTGTRAVTWTLYERVADRTWNEASKFCKERGGYLPVINTHITKEALFNISTSWESITRNFWLGLYSAVSGEVPNVWEADCCLRPPEVSYWAPVNEEPNNLDTEHCCRHDINRVGWRTIVCSKTYKIVCEIDRGNCTYETLNDTTITTLPDVSKGHVDDVSTCWSLCLELRHNSKECVAAVLEETLCKMYVSKRLLEENQVETYTRSGSVVMLRRCFHSMVNQDQFSGFTYTDTSSDPNPWSVMCSAEYNVGVDPPDFLPPGVEPGLVTMATFLPASTENAAAPETTTAAATEAPAAAASSPSATQSFSTQSESPTETATIGFTMIPPPSLSSAISSLQSSSPETTATTAAEDVTTSNPKPTVCPCICPYNSSSASEHPVNLTVIAKNHYLTVIVKNQTSKYRRAKTSVWTGQTSHAIVGAPWIVACVCFFFCIVLCDLNPRKWRPDKRRGDRKTKVAPEP